ncbi:MAG: ribosome biogenesis GTP-binding protein YihA/YsxC [Arenicella sp.]
MSNNPPLPKILGNPQFMLGAAKITQCPNDSGTEIAFAGRSNVGKSSALNKILQRKKIARTSKTPGRTQEINFFSVSDTQRLVDLPGYGFAKVPLAVRKEWEKFISQYLRERQSLVGLIQLMDVRHPLTDLDQKMLAWSQQAGLPVHILLNKSDKLKPGAAKNVLLDVVKQLESMNIEGSIQLFSANSGMGLADCRTVICDWLDTANVTESEAQQE